MTYTLKEHIDFLICNYNGGIPIIKCIETILDLGCENANIFIYDNASTDFSLDSIKKKFRSIELTIIEGESNIGYGNAINRLFDISTSPYIFILNPDAELQFSAHDLDGIIRECDESTIYGFNILNLNGTLQNFLASEPNYLWVVGGLLRIGFPIIFEPFYSKYFKSHYYDHIIKPNNQVDFVSGCALLMMRSSFLKIGKFNSKYFLYFEDTELLHTAKKLGFFIRKSSLDIKHEASFSFKNSSALIKVEKYRSALIYFKNTRGYSYALFVRVCVVFISILAVLNPINIFKRKLGRYFGNLIFLKVRNK